MHPNTLTPTHTRPRTHTLACTHPFENSHYGNYRVAIANLATLFCGCPTELFRFLVSILFEAFYLYFFSHIKSKYHFRFLGLCSQHNMKSNNNLSNAIFVCCRRLCNEFYAPFTPIFVMAAALAICSGRVTWIEERGTGDAGEH